MDKTELKGIITISENNDVIIKPVSPEININIAIINKSKQNLNRFKENNIIYLLLNTTPDKNHKFPVYVGKTERANTRLSGHVKKKNWTKGLIVSREHNNDIFLLDEISFLEFALCSRLKSLNQYQADDNKQNPQPPNRIDDRTAFWLKNIIETILSILQLFIYNVDNTTSSTQQVDSIAQQNAISANNSTVKKTDKCITIKSPLDDGLFISKDVIKNERHKAEEAITINDNCELVNALVRLLDNCANNSWSGNATELLNTIKPNIASWSAPGNPRVLSERLGQSIEILTSKGMSITWQRKSHKRLIHITKST